MVRHASGTDLLAIHGGTQAEVRGAGRKFYWLFSNNITNHYMGAGQECVTESVSPIESVYNT